MGRRARDFGGFFLRFLLDAGGQLRPAPHAFISIILGFVGGLNQHQQVIGTGRRINYRSLSEKARPLSTILQCIV